MGADKDLNKRTLTLPHRWSERQIRAAQLATACRAEGEDDLRRLLDVLGLLPAECRRSG